MTDSAATIATRPGRPALPLLAYLALVVAVFCWVALARGPWMDEFWTMILSDPGVPVGRMIAERWLPDTHPPLFNALVYLLRHAIDATIEQYRVILNLAALAVAALAHRAIAGRDRASRAFVALYAVILLSVPVVMRAFADFRPYFIIFCAIGVFVHYGHALSLADPDGRRRPAIGWGMASAYLSIATHYVVGITSSILVVAMLLLVIGARRERVLIGLAAVAGWATMLVLARLQVPIWGQQLDVVLGRQSPGAVLATVARTIGFTIGCGLPALAAAWWFRATMPRPARFQAALWLTAIAGTACIAGIAVVLNKPVAVDRYFATVIVAIVASIAALNPAVWRDRPLARWGLVLCAAALVIAGGIRKAREPQWLGGGRAVAAAQRACPATRVLAVSPWTLIPQHASRYAARETIAVDLGYRTVADRLGLRIERRPTVRPATPLEVRPGACPVLLWVEHLLSRPSADRAFALAGLRLPPGTRVTPLPTHAERDLVLEATRPR